jgi:hypothetical protein
VDNRLIFDPEHKCSSTCTVCGSWAANTACCPLNLFTGLYSRGGNEHGTCCTDRLANTADDHCRTAQREEVRVGTQLYSSQRLQRRVPCQLPLPPPFSVVYVMRVPLALNLNPLPPPPPTIPALQMPRFRAEEPGAEQLIPPPPPSCEGKYLVRWPICSEFWGEIFAAPGGAGHRH